MVPSGVGPGQPLAVLCGPTAVGKTAVALPLAERLGAEIVCADSRTVYRGLDVGTAKPTAAQRARVPHHLLDVAAPNQTFTVADFQRLARQAIEEIRGRGRLPLIVGGSGLYIRAVVDDLTIPPVAPNRALRARLAADEQTSGPGHLHARLAALDPAAAARINPANLRRITRALEVIFSTGRPISAQQGKVGTAPTAVVGLTMVRDVLYRRIEARVAEQIAAGLVDEVRGLVAAGIPPEAAAMQGLGYKEIAAWLDGSCGFDEAVRRLVRNTRRFAKRQLTWFRRDPRVVWIDATDLGAEALAARAHAIMDAEFSPHRRA